MDRMYGLVTELKRSRAPQLLQTLRGSCVMQLKEVFSSLPKDTHPNALAQLVQLLLDHCPDTPHFELVACNVVEDVCWEQGIERKSRDSALAICTQHASPLAPSLSFSLTMPLFEDFPKAT